MNSKEFFFDKAIVAAGGADRSRMIRVLELGCGTAKYVPKMLERYPNLTYVGVEPIATSFAKAKQTLGGVERIEIYSQLGYGAVEGLADASFDLVISFSVLEHVKQLEVFMKMAARYVKSGGLMVHRYDLGHALYPSSLKERLHVFLGNSLPAVLPERTFVRYVPAAEVANLYQKYLGVTPHMYTYHQIPDIKSLTKALAAEGLSEACIEPWYAWEFEHKDTIGALPVRTREHLFPSVALWGVRQ